MPSLLRPRTTLSAPCLVRVKTRARSTFSCWMMSDSICGLLPRSTWMIALRDALDRRGLRRHRRPSPGPSASGGELGDVLRHGGGEEQRLPLRRQLREILRMSWMKPMSSMRSASSSTNISTLLSGARCLHEVEQAARRRDQHVDAVEQRAHLGAHRHAADGERRLMRRWRP